MINVNGLYLAPHPRFVEGDGLSLKHGNDISDGAGLLMGKNISFRIFPFWEVIVIIYLEEMYKTKYSVFLLPVWHL